jgi:hypothetical protein
MTIHPGLLAAAVGGLLLGAGCASTPSHADPSTPGTSATTTAGGENHGCKGPNACKNQGASQGADHGCKGMNECKAQGGCHTDNHGCKGQNDCKGQGGCKSA